MARYNFKYIVGCVIGILGATFALLLLGSTVSGNGYLVPDDLDQLTAPAGQEIDAPCLPKEQVDDETLQQIKAAAGQNNIECEFNERAIENGDALLGAITLLVFGGIALLLLKLNNSAWKGDVLQFGLAILVTGLLVWYFDDKVKEWFTDWGVVYAIFWRGFFAALILLGTLGFGHEAQRKRTP